MTAAGDADVREHGALLFNKNAPISSRIRAIFYLKQAALKSNAAMDYMISGIYDDSVLLSHECAYCLGQTQNPYALAALRAVLQDRSLHPILRHEAAEGIGAVSVDEDLALLEKYVADDAVEVAETCQIAIDRIHSGHPAVFDARFESVDPAPSAEIPDGCHDSVDAIPVWGVRLRDEQRSLFDRYRAMFALRDEGSDEAVKGPLNVSIAQNSSGFTEVAELSASLSDRTSALFRHEVAYVLGQLQHPLSRDALIRSLKDREEHEMVRHEVAISLGAIADAEAIEVLQAMLKDPDAIVRESAEVALDLYTHWNEEGMSED